MTETADEFDQGMPWSDDAEAPDEGQPSAETEAAPEEGQPAEEEQAEDPDVANVLAKYGGDVNKALKALDESQSHIGSLHAEIGQLRQLQEQQFAWERQRAQQESQPDYEDYLEDDPRKALNIALGSQNQVAIDEAWKGWYEDEPAEAQLWREQYNMQRIQHAVSQGTRPAQEERFHRRLAMFQRDNPDTEQLTPQMGAVLDEFPILKFALENPEVDPDSRFNAWKQTYEVAKARSSATLRSATQEVARAQAEAAEEAQRDAFVASSSNAVRESPDGQSAADILAEGWDRTGIHWGE